MNKLKKEIRLIPVFIFLSTILGAQAPSFVDFEWGFSMGYANASKFEGVNSGMSLHSDFRYNAKDNLTIGLDFGVSFFFENIEGDNVDMNSITASVLSVDRFFGAPSSKRSYVGIGIGEHSSRLTLIREDTEEDISLNKRSSFALSLRAGHEYDHMRFQLQYNISTQKEFSNYVNFTIGFVLFGGYQGDE